MRGGELSQVNNRTQREEEGGERERERGGVENRTRPMMPACGVSLLSFG